MYTQKSEINGKEITAQHRKEDTQVALFEALKARIKTAKEAGI